MPQATPAAPGSAQNRLRTAILGAILVLVTLIAYWPALDGEFLWDDIVSIPRNELMRSGEGLWRIWTDPAANPVTEQHHPLVQTTFWLEYRLWGDDPRGFHVVNVLLHGLNALLGWLLLRRLAVPGAWFAGWIFALHPVHVESTAWIIERKDLMSAGFCLLAAMAYLSFGERKRIGFYLLALGLFACAMLSKTIVLGFPVLLGLVLWWKGRLRPAGREIARLVPFAVVGVTLFLVSYELLVNPRTEELRPAYLSLVDLSFLERLLVAGRALVFYTGKLLLPAKLCGIYPAWDVRVASVAQWSFPVAVAGALAALWALRARIGRGPIAACLFYCIAIGPALGFFTFYLMPYTYVADRFQYLGSWGPIALIAAGLTLGARRLGAVVQAWARPAAVVLLALLGLLTFEYSRAFADMGALFTDAVAKGYESAGTHFRLATFYERESRPADAIEHYRRATELDPLFHPAFIQLGTHLVAARRLDEAIPVLEEAVRLYPEGIHARNNLAVALAARGRVGDAVTVLRENLRRHPGDVNSRLNLGYFLLRSRDLDGAIEQFEALLKQNPGVQRAIEGLELARRAKAAGY